LRALIDRTRAVGAALLLAALAGACSGGKPSQRSSVVTPAPVVVASFNFPESVLLADIYGQALQQAGVPVRLELDLGPRELVLPAVHQGLVDVVPEYLGSLLEALDPGARLQGASAADEARQLAPTLKPWNVSTLPPAPAEDQNGLVVTQSLAQRYGLHAISQLVAIAPHLTLGAPTECPTRPFCLLGLQSVYGLRFAHFDAFDDESQRVTALEEQVIGVAVMDTSDGELATGQFVVLSDDRHLQPADNVAPLVSARAVRTYGDRVVTALDAVSARLSSRDLTFLNWRVEVAGNDPGAEAHAWLVREGLVPRS
jgi:osmoprotectant transport system substrate-binding protein